MAQVLCVNREVNVSEEGSGRGGEANRSGQAGDVIAHDA